MEHKCIWVAQLAIWGRKPTKQQSKEQEGRGQAKEIQTSTQHLNQTLSQPFLSALSHPSLLPLQDGGWKMLSLCTSPATSERIQKFPLIWHAWGRKLKSHQEENIFLFFLARGNESSNTKCISCWEATGFWHIYFMNFTPARFPREIKWNKYLPGKGARQKHEICLPRPSFLAITASLMLLTRTASVHHQSNEIKWHSTCFRLLSSRALLFQSGRNKPFHFGQPGLGTENLPGLVRVLG